MKPLTIEIHGTGTCNRGAELMAIAIASRLRAEFSDLKLVVPRDFGRFEDRGRHGFWTTWESSLSFQDRARSAAKYMPRFVAQAMSDVDRFCQRGVAGHPRILDRGGILNPAEIDVVLDASGFAFSDQWGDDQARRLFDKMNSRPRRDKPLVLMPQALGPFEDPNVRRWTKCLFDRCSLCFARDSFSMAAMQQIIDSRNSNKLQHAPDFTLAVNGYSPEGLQLPTHFTAIVPNYRMIDKGENDWGYCQWLVHVFRLLETHEMSPLFVLHDTLEDRAVVDEVEAHGIHVPVISNDDPRVLKGVLGKATFVVASRFHALVSALSSGVPCLGAGWSHKYRELFTDFDCCELFVDNPKDLTMTDRIVGRLLESQYRENVRVRIERAAIALREQCNFMWEQVIDLCRSMQ